MAKQGIFVIWQLINALILHGQSTRERPKTMTRGSITEPQLPRYLRYEVKLSSINLSTLEDRKEKENKKKKEWDFPFFAWKLETTRG
ncbi:hypothetical protein ACN38_g5308 [Penicillium nordicum]|uniref:Secreted protein n=1 Tax=Penicillium nordicum TaxID=229535 RepID=A0A0M8P921_9EURO|nr:hypothetical protein ACN38_g5308 [Penicillium nordicum]